MHGALITFAILMLQTKIFIHQHCLILAFQTQRPQGLHVWYWFYQTDPICTFVMFIDWKLLKPQHMDIFQLFVKISIHVFWMIWSLWNLTGVSLEELPKKLVSIFRVISTPNFSVSRLHIYRDLAVRSLIEYFLCLWVITPKTTFPTNCLI